MSHIESREDVRKMSDDELQSVLNETEYLLENKPLTGTGALMELHTLRTLSFWCRTEMSIREGRKAILSHSE